MHARRLISGQVFSLTMSSRLHCRKAHQRRGLREHCLSLVIRLVDRQLTAITKPHYQDRLHAAAAEARGARGRSGPWFTGFRRALALDPKADCVEALGRQPPMYFIDGAGTHFLFDLDTLAPPRRHFLHRHLCSAAALRRSSRRPPLLNALAQPRFSASSWKCWTMSDFQGSKHSQHCHSPAHSDEQQVHGQVPTPPSGSPLRQALSYSKSRSSVISVPERSRVLRSPESQP